jgi:catechol 2,3-dioxygenase-like lactoylglutathione lyase family enzyme
MLSHAAWVTHDVEATAEFYMRIMGMELASTVVGARIPSTGEDIPYFHIFFRMADGSTIAFFEAPGLPKRATPTHPAYDVFDHIALRVKDHAEVDRWHAWLTQNNVPVVGPTDHDGLIYSIYFRDPNGVRLEITTPTDPEWNRHTERGKAALAWWCDGKRQAVSDGEAVGPALVRMIHAQKAEKAPAEAS